MMVDKVYAIQLFSTDNFDEGMPIEAGSGAADITIGSTLTWNGNGDAAYSRVSDGDEQFGETDATQALNFDITLNGMTYVAGTNIAGEYVLELNTEADGSGDKYVVTGAVFGPHSSGNHNNPVDFLSWTYGEGGQGVPPAGTTLFVVDNYTTAGSGAALWANGVADYDIPCFTTGTLIDTDRGQVAVEDLKAGDKVRTMDHGFQPVRWVGQSRVHDTPIRIKAGTFNNTRDMVVSPRHRMLLQGWQVGLLFNHDEAFATASDLKNGTTIAQEPEGWVEYYHILFDNHEVIFAEDAATESFYPDAASLNGMAKATRDELSQAVDLTTFGKTARPTLTTNQAMYVGHNLDMLEDERTQIQAAE